MKKYKLNYCFHNPNTNASSIDYILKILIEANMGKVDQILRESAEALPDEKEQNEVKEHIV